MASVPSIEYGLSDIPVGARSNAHRHGRIIEETNHRWAVPFRYIEPVAPALEKVAFTCREFPQGLAILLLEFRLLPMNPAEAGNDSHAHRVIIKTERSGHPYPTVRRIYTYVKVFDVLVDDVYHSPLYRDSAGFPLSIHSAPLQSRICGTRDPRFASVQLQHGDVSKFSEVMVYPGTLSFRKRIILSWFAVRLENCFSQTSLKRANTFRLIDS